MKKESDDFIDEKVLQKVNQAIEKQLLEELEHPERAEPKKEEKTSIFMWFILVIMFSIVIMKLGTIILPFIW